MFAEASTISEWLNATTAIVMGVGFTLGFVTHAIKSKLAQPKFEDQPTKVMRPVKFDVPSREPAHEPFEVGSKKERRYSIRRAGNPVQVSIYMEGAEGVAIEGWVKNRSLGGLCLDVPREFQPGTALKIRSSVNVGSGACVDVEVRNCTRTDDGIRIGCQFRSKPNWSELLLFG